MTFIGAVGRPGPRSWPGKRPRGLVALVAIATVAAVCITGQLNVSLAVTAAASTAAAAVGGGTLLSAGTSQRCRPPIVATFTSHKTGTATVGCLKAYAVLGARQPVAHFYEDLANSSHALAGFAAAATGGATQCPTAVVYTSGDYLPRLEDEHCPFPACPCDADGQARCESLLGGTLTVPGGDTTLILVVRNPLDVVLSALFYHRQQPAPEQWIDAASANALGAAWLQEGAPPAPLKALGWEPGSGFAGAGPEQSYGSYLRQLPLEQAVRLEFWRSSRSLHGTSRMYASLPKLYERGTKVQLLRFEALKTDFNATAATVLAAFAERLPGLDAPSQLARSQGCNPATWSAGQQQANAAEKADPELRSRLQAALWSDGAILRRLCRLTAALEYPLPPECGGMSEQSGAFDARAH